MREEQLEKYNNILQFIKRQEIELIGYSAFEGDDKEIMMELIARRLMDYVETLNQK